MTLRAILSAVLLWLTAAVAHAGDLSVAVAANFTEPAKAIAAAFEAKTGTHVTLSFGASGAFFSQIEQGAPFDAFLSADSERPEKLEADGYTIKGTRFVYAYGKLALWSATPGLVDSQGKILSAGTWQKVAIADPAAAPYGTAAVETLKRLGLYDKVAAKIVKGSSIAQAYGFVDSGSAELGFVALSQIYRSTKGSRWLVPAADYTPIDQQAVLLKDNPNGRAWMAFLKSPAVVALIKSYGYEIKP